MQTHNIEQWQQNHDFSVHNKQGERRTYYVLILTAITMIVEIIAGSIYGSMALLADGWHMGTHVAAFMIAIFAYRYARKHANNPEFSFGTGKVNALGGFASAIALAIVALVMLVESLQRIFEPHTIQFNEAIIVASIGLLVNIISAWLLKDDHSHSHHHADDDHDDHHEHHDHNLRAAYAHVLADAITSVLAITALVAGKYLGWNWLDPIMGIVGAIIITRWAYGLMKETSPLLLDASIAEDYKFSITQAIENDADNEISDIHVWKIGANDYAAIISIVTHAPNTPDYYKALLKDFDKLSHITIEINQCTDERCDLEN
ncbi:MAG: CDF family Co(II)/Ni(II) efflux transporter DmeF [Pseudomonadota bacterium]|nr:CDF family Co(II)/Ni(II) efflux transporter DmeF [Pseudomonadota bacterium]MDO7710929.1 CDF family Co(II)/Ni(II) efflux transporter DmeF [Pseudomonadota bacterium]